MFISLLFFGMAVKLPSRPGTAREILPSTDHSHGVETEGERGRGAGEVGNEIENIEEEGEEEEEEEEEKEKEEKEEKKEEKKEKEEDEEEKEMSSTSDYHSEFEDGLFCLTPSVTDYLAL
ncbi:hypothetical protein BDDG_09591, partial [Blastomyces dermatitidis ATCC 18188]